MTKKKAPRRKKVRTPTEERQSRRIKQLEQQLKKAKVTIELREQATQDARVECEEALTVEADLRERIVEQRDKAKQTSRDFYEQLTEAQQVLGMAVLQVKEEGGHYVKLSTGPRVKKSDMGSNATLDFLEKLRKGGLDVQIKASTEGLVR